MNRKLIAGLALVLLAAIVVWFVARGTGSGAGKGGKTGGSSAGIKDPRPRTGSGSADDLPAGPRSWDVDPTGSLALEGQVLDDQDRPVKGAEVSLASAPARTSTTDDDGTFTFDKLVGRSYAVSARAGDLVGGPVVQQLTATSPPVVIRMRKGATLAVHVLADGDATPIAGAAVELRDAIAQSATTDATGVATFHGISPGWAQVVATAPGYAASNAGTLVTISAVAVELNVIMRKGASVSGRVVDEAGAPVADAYVVRQDAGRVWMTGNVEKDAIKTTATGEFTFAVVPTGSFRFVAHHDRLAPGSSQPVTVDGATATKGVEIVMRQGATISGVVVDKSGAPSPHASVSVAPKHMVDFQTFGGGMRRITADEKGAFEIRALPRSPVRLRAESAVAASAITEVDLTTAPTQTTKLVLDVSGTIAGTVVDSKNNPVPEVQVAAVVDVGAGGDIENYALTGFASATTDGGGGFVIHGLADGAYQLSAHRSGMSIDEGWMSRGTKKARTGDTNVRLVMPTPGAIKGTLVLAAGGVPKLATVSVSWTKSTPAINGEFVLDDLAPGSYDLTVRGPEFVETSRRDVDVVEGKAADAGAIKLERGRKLIGTVVDSSGNAVAGAQVRLGKMIFTEGGKAANADPNIDQMMGHRVTTTSADGRFTLVGITKDEASVVAEHADRGRSDAIKLPGGQGDPPELHLVLHGFGSIAGVVKSKGQPVQAMVTAMPKSGGAQLVSVQSGPDGAFVIDKISEGTHRLTAMRMGMMSMSSSEGVDVVIKAGERLTRNIDIAAGDLTVAVEIKPKAGAKVDAAQVFVFRGVVGAKNGKDLMDAFTGGGASASGMKFWLGQGKVTFEEQLPGRVSICSIPITGDLSDPQFQQRLQQHGDLLAVFCMAVELPPNPKEQSYTQELPAMTPLPET